MKQKNKVMISQSNYIPWKGYFDNINQVDIFLIYDDAQYTKRDWRNRNQIKTPQGLKWLSIPVNVKGKFEQKINQTIIADPEWGKKHWASIKQNYSKAAYFKNYKDVFEELYKDTSELNLSKVNQSFIKTINGILGIKTKILRSDDYELSEGKNERLLDLCITLNTSEYYSGPAAKSYLDVSLFESKGVKVNFFSYAGYPEYKQQYEGFEHGVSILDLLFNEGENATKYMLSFK